MQVLEKENQLQRKAAIFQFVNCEVYKEYKEELEKYVESTQEEINELVKSSVNAEQLSKLNFKAGQKAGANLALYWLKNLEEEI